MLHILSIPLPRYQVTFATEDAEGSFFVESAAGCEKWAEEVLGLSFPTAERHKAGVCNYVKMQCAKSWYCGEHGLLRGDDSRGDFAPTLCQIRLVVGFRGCCLGCVWCCW